jgi:hypothetical protein
VEGCKWNGLMTQIAASVGFIYLNATGLTMRATRQCYEVDKIYINTFTKCIKQDLPDQFILHTTAFENSIAEVVEVFEFCHLYRIGFCLSYSAVME